MSSSSSSLRLQEALQACSQSSESGDLVASNAAVAAVSDLLNSVSELEDDNLSEELLVEIHRFLSSPSSNQMVIDALSFELPKVVAKFGALSDKCRELAKSIVEHLVCTCSPREMLSILCEALDMHIRVSVEPTYFIVLLDGLAKVLIFIQRRHVEQVKVVLPIILKVLYEISMDSHEEAKDTVENLFEAAIRIGTSVQEICEKMVGRMKEELCAILGLYVLQNIALISRSRQKHIISSCGSFVLQLSKFLPFCGFSYFGLISGSNVASATTEISKSDVEDSDDFMDCFPLAMDGAALAVIWGYASDDIAKSAGEQLEFVLKKIQNICIERWQAVGMLKRALASIDYPWEIKSKTIELLLSIMDRDRSEESDDDSIDFSPFAPSHFITLQAIERIMIGSSDASLRKKAFAALKKLYADIPSSHRFDVLKALITNSNSPSMTAILIDLVKEEILAENHQKDIRSVKDNQFQNGMQCLYWSSHAFDLVELTLKPPEGGPPALPEQSEPILSALNLLRFILITESTGTRNRTTIFSEKILQKVYFDWLLPLRTLITGIQAETEKDADELSDCISCALNPVQLVLYRCIELVEESMKKS
ncbi:aberrant root formation protein 4 isoform X1 [Typha angustifolia]|uniref:aberrant root formation protein 4 isoform X1 n=1 Tax=Typha angustifolia TaxID=59011 RepID=UPI003C2FD951